MKGEEMFMSSFVLGFQDIDKTKLMVVGGKGANLGELSRIDGIRVPEGFCITTEAYKRIISQTPEFHDLLEQLSLLKASVEIQKPSGTCIPSILDSSPRFAPLPPTTMSFVLSMS